MRTYALLLLGSLVVYSPSLNAQSSKRTQRETIVIKRSGSGSTTVDISGNGIYVNGERVATRTEVNNKNLTKRIIVEDGDSRPGTETRSYNEYYNSGGTNDSRRAVLGVYSGQNRSNSGAYIQSITPSSAAERSGLRAGDFITRVDTSNIYTAEDLTRVIKRYNPGDRVTISYSRNGRDRQTTASLSEAPSQGWSRIYESTEPWMSERNDPVPEPIISDDENFASGKPKLGVAVEDLADGKGVRVLSVKPNSPADLGGVKTDDIITSIDGTRVDNVEDLQRVAGSYRAGNKLKLSILRDGYRMGKTVTLPKPKDVRDL